MWSKNGHQKYASLEEIGLRAKNLLIILGSVVTIIGVTYMIIQEEHE